MKRKPRSKQFQRKKRNKSQEPKGNKIFYGLISILIVFLFLVTSCGEGTGPSPIPQKGKSLLIKEKQVKPVKAEVDKGLEKKEEAEYAYDPTGKTDPFKPFIQMGTGKGYSRNALLTPLQKYEISQLKLVAIILDPKGNVALIEDSLGKGYVLKKGTGIGKNDGKVTKILKDKIIIVEIYQDIWGQTKINAIPLYLHRLEEEEGES